MASATTGNNYFTKSMNSIIEIDDGAGTTISDGAIFTNSISTDNFNTTSLTCDTIDTNTIDSTTGNIGTGNIGTLSSTLGTITTLNSTTGNIGTMTSNSLISNNIQSKLTTDTLDLTAKIINLNGTQSQTKTYISKYNNNSIEMTTNTGISYIDFHSSNSSNDYDARIQCFGGTSGQVGSGGLTVSSNSMLFEMPNSIELKTPSIFCTNPGGTTPTLNIPIIESSTINNSGTITSDILIADVSGSIPTLTTFTINNLANIVSSSSQYWKTGGVVMRPYNKVPNSSSWFSMNYDDSSNIERNALQFDAGAYGVNLIVDDNLPFAINENGVDQVTMTPSTGWTFNNKINTTYDASFGVINSSTINNSGTLTTNALNLTSGSFGITTLNSTTINNSGTATSNILNATTSGTIPTFNSTTSNITTGNITTLNSTTINNSGTATSNILNATISGTIPTFNSTTGNITTLNSTTINNSGTATTNSLVTNSISKSTGTLAITAPTIQLNGNVQFSNWLNTQTIGGKSLNTTYQNIGTAPKFISVSATNATSSVLTAKAGTSSPPTPQVAYTTLFNSVGQTLFFIVLPGNYYRVETSAGGTLQVWTEWA